MALLVALFAATLSLTAGTAAAATSAAATTRSGTAVGGPVIDPTGPCYRPPRICFSFDAYTRAFTAYSLYDVSATPHYITIYRLDDGALLNSCGYGTTCVTGPVPTPPRGWCHQAKAFIGGFGVPPATLVSQSSTVTYCGLPL